MSDKIRVLIVDDLSETRENVRKLLQFEPDIEVIGQAGTGEEAIEVSRRDQPDIVLMDINMPGIDGITASQTITEQVPYAQIIIMSVQSDPDYMRRAMLAGTRYFLTKPFGGDELVSSIRNVYEKRTVRVSATAVSPITTTPKAQPATPAHILTVFSPKGGLGCTTIATNLAVALAKSGQRTILIDGSLQFGDVAVMLNMKSMTNITDLLDGRNQDFDPELLSSVVQTHSETGLHVLLSPPRPEMADIFKENHARQLLETARKTYDFVIIDTSSALDDITLAWLDAADKILLITRQNLPSLKSTSRFIDLTQNLEYPADKIWLAANFVTNRQGIALEDITNILKRPVIAAIPTDDATVQVAGDKGIPLIMDPARRNPVRDNLSELADYTMQELIETEAVEETKPRGWRLFGNRN